MIIAPIDVVQPIVVAGILGFQTWFVQLVGVIIFMFVGLFVFIKMYDGYKHEQNVKKTTMPNGITRKINGVFITEGQTGYERICDCDMDTAKIPEKEKKKGAIGTMTAPKVTSQRIPDYYLYPGYGVQVFWPKGARLRQQVQIMQFFYRENYPFPTFGWKELSDEERTTMTGILANIQADQGVANAVVTEVQQKFEAFTRALKELWAWRPMRYVIYGILALIAINIFITFRVYSVVISIARVIIGG